MFGAEALQLTWVMKSSSPGQHRQLLIRGAASGAQPLMKIERPGCSVINAGAGAVRLGKWNKVRCPSLKPTRTRKALMPLGRAPEWGLLSESRNSSEEIS